MKLRMLLLLLVIGSAFVVALLMAYLNRVDISKREWHAVRHRPSAAEEDYVDWALEQLHLEKAKPTHPAATASAADRGREEARGDSLLPEAYKTQLARHPNQLHCLDTEKIKKLLSGEVAYEEAPLPNGDRAGEQGTNNTRLHVIVIPFSHSDPGWIYTIDEYFASHTRRTLDLMVEKLEQYEDLKFVWSEAVFLHMWWQNLTDSVKDAVRRLIATGRLQIAHGSWVMADEAVNSLYALVTNMAVGHEFVRRELHPGFVPRHGWGVDVFGYSLASARLQRAAGLEALVLLRVHSQVKSFLSRRQALEFYWSWPHRYHPNDTLTPGDSIFDDDRLDAIFCHIEPGRLYSIKHSCGPDPRVCFQFDFRHIDGIDPVDPSFDLVITDANIAQKAALLAEQYRLKSQPFVGNAAALRPVAGGKGGSSSSSSDGHGRRGVSAIMVPLGDDFRFDQAKEWDQQYTNYRRLFDYYAAHPELGIEARFGTPADYFALVGGGSAANGGGSAPANDGGAAAGSVGGEDEPMPNNQLPIALPPSPPSCLVGDFFPYIDEPAYADYWTGFYSTRMWLKVHGRKLERHLRTAQILHVGSLLLLLSKRRSAEEGNHSELEREAALLQDAERSLALFAHHDAVTGTSKPHVAVDYHSKLTAAIVAADAVAARSVRRLTESSGAPSRPQTSAVHDVSDEPLVTFDHILPSNNLTGERDANGNRVLRDFDKGIDVTLFNPLVSDVQTVVRLAVDRPDVAVFADTASTEAPTSTAGMSGQGRRGGLVTACQVSPTFADADLCEPSGYQLALQVRLQALGSVGLSLRPSAAAADASDAAREGEHQTRGGNEHQRRSPAGDRREGPLVCTLAKVTSFARDAAQASRQKACLTGSAATAKAAIGDSRAAEWRRSMLVRLASRATDGRFLAVAAAGRVFFSASSGLPLAMYPGCPAAGTAAASAEGPPPPVAEEPIAINLHMAAYRSSMSGAYIFRLREAELSATHVERLPLFASAVVKAVGPVETVVSSVRCWNGSGLASTAASCLSVATRLTDVDGGLHVTLRSLLGFPQQLVMRLNTSVRNDDRAFHTDSNGLGLVARKAHPSLPPAGNYHPMTAAALIEDASGGDGDGDGGGSSSSRVRRRRRITVLAGQPGGVTSLTGGQLEVMVDRRLSADDGRGLGEGVNDNRVTASVFRLLPELLPAESALRDGEAADLSPAATLLLLELQNPIAAFSSRPTSGGVAAAPAAFRTLAGPGVVPCGGVVHLLMARALPADLNGNDDGSARLNLAVVVYVAHADGSLLGGDPSSVGCVSRASQPTAAAAAGGPSAAARCPGQRAGASEATFDVAALVSSGRKPSAVSLTTLSMMQTRAVLTSEAAVSLPAGDVYAFNVTFSLAPAAA